MPDGSSLRMTPGTITAHLAHLQHGSHTSDTPSKLSWWAVLILLAGEQGVVAAMRSIEGLASSFVARLTKARTASGYRCL
jgi:hypothetical protein